MNSFRIIKFDIFYDLCPYPNEQEYYINGQPRQLQFYLTLFYKYCNKRMLQNSKKINIEKSILK